MDSTQLLLSVILTVTTILMIVVGIQLIFLLRDLRVSIKKVNGIIEGFEKVGMTVEHGFEQFTGFLHGIKTIFKIVDVVHSKKNAKSK